MMSRLEARSVVERKHPSLPRFLAIPSDALAPWQLRETTMVEADVNGVAIGWRSLKRWGPGRDCWFIDLTDAQCRAARVETGDRVSLGLRPAPTRVPDALDRLLRTNRSARRRWDALSPARRRQVAEHVRAGKRSETRVRRARQALLGRAGPRRR
ncbi:MAG: YdeI/OmpD-associated family protein [Gemmatimonadetes bacterium]|nr:YdeI/OmpD-associated family protein [Gemmatimonadota bacterium]